MRRRIIIRKKKNYDEKEEENKKGKWEEERKKKEKSNLIKKWERKFYLGRLNERLWNIMEIDWRKNVYFFIIRSKGRKK